MNIDLYHATDHRIPLLKDTPVIATLHDAVPFTHPEWVNPRWRRSKNWLMRKSAQWADHIICVSQAAVTEVVEHWGVSEQRVSVIHHGVDQQRFRPVAADITEAAVKRFKLPERYLLFIGTLQPRKNLPRLLEAYQNLPAELRKQYPLVIAGRLDSESRKTCQQLRQAEAEGDVHLLGYVEGDDIPLLYQRASLFILPSLHEGFGLPVLEAMASGVPVLCSALPVTREVGGDAVATFNPESVSALTASICELLYDSGYRKKLVEAGHERVKHFTWQVTAQKTAELYHRLLRAS